MRINVSRVCRGASSSALAIRQHACCLMALLCPWVCVASKTPMPTATHSWARDGQRRQTSVQQVCNKCATSVQQVWYLLRGVIELAAFAKPTVARLDEKLTVWLSGPCAHHAQTRTLTRRAPHARASPEGDRRRQRGGRRETIRDRRKDSCRHPSPHPTGKSPRPRPSAD